MTTADPPRILPGFDAPSLESSRIDYYGRYFGDPMSRVFRRNQGFEMGMLHTYGKAFDVLLKSGKLNDLISRGLLTLPEAADPTDSGFESVYRLHCRARVTCWHEWSPKMLRSGALRLLELLRELAERGLTLRNPHPWNLLYDGQVFVYLNSGSIVPLDKSTFARSYEKVARFFVRPLLLIENGFSHIAQRLISDVRDGALAEDVRHLHGDLCEWDSDKDDALIAPFLSHAASRIESFCGNAESNRWFDYFETDCDFRPGTSWTAKQQVLETMLKDTRIRSVLDLGTNTGHYARVAAQRGREVIAADFDPSLVDRTFDQSRAENLPVYPVVLDFSHPSPGQGVAGDWFLPASERLKTDLVLCFALSHHMVFGKFRLDFEQVAKGVRSFTREWALVEYVERGKIRPSEFRPEADAWYDVQHLERALERHFPVVQSLPPALDGRRIVVCGPHRGAL